jgi:TetR/AcrR family fatty acid metabolism transcriptional regulator
MNIHSFTTKAGMTFPDPKDRNPKYNRILEAAVKIFARQGFRQATIAQIAREAGVADGTIYLYFKNKDDILVHFFSFKAKQVFDRFHEAVACGANSIEKLRNLVRVHLAEFQRDPDMAIVYHVETHQISRLAEEQIRAMGKMYHDLVSDIVEEGQQDGLMRRDLYLGLVKRLILGAINETIGAWLHSGRGYDLISMADPLTDLLIRGIEAPARFPKT